MTRLLSFVFFLIIGCQWSTAQENNIVAYKDLAYKITSELDTIKLDVFMPAMKRFAKTPLVVHIHGGAWLEGDKSFENQYYMRSLRDSLVSKGYALISINYRLLNPDVQLEDQLSDSYDALKWIRDHADVYQLDLDNVGIMGESAGAHLAQMLAYSDVEVAAVDFRYIIDIFGPTDLNNLFKTDAGFLVKTLFKAFKPKLYHLRNRLITFMTSYDLDKDKKNTKAVLAKYSPLTYLDGRKKTPALIQHGDKDPIVPYSQSVKLKKKLDEYGIENKFMTVDKGNHGFTTTDQDRLNELIHASLDFIKWHAVAVD